MKVNVTRKIVIAAASSFALASYLIAGAPGGVGHFGSQSMAPGNSSFGHSQAVSAGNPQRGPGNSAFGRSTAADARSDSSTNTDTNGKSKHAKLKKAKNATSRGNSAFGHRQGDAATRTRGSQNNAYGKAQSARVKHAKTLSLMERSKRFLMGPRHAKAKNATTRGNSAFGHRQGDATTRTRGSQNNAYGKTQSARVKHTKALSLMERSKRFLMGQR